MIEFTTTNKNGKKIKINAPNQWNELSVSQFVKIENCKSRNVLELFSIISGLNISVPENSKDKNLEKSIWEITSFIGDQVDWEKVTAPTHYEISGKIYKVPVKFDKMMVGQKIMLAQTILKVEDMINQMPKIMAIIFMPQYTEDGSFKSEKLDELAGKILHSIGIDGYGIVKGFFLTSKHLKSYGMIGLTEFLDRKEQVTKPQRNWLKLRD